MQVRGLAAQKSGDNLSPFEFQRRELGDHDVALDISFAGICHSDIHQVREEERPR